MLEFAGALVQSRLRNSEGTVGAVVGYMLGLTNSRMPQNCRSSRTTCVNSAACDFAVSARGPKSATATRGLLVSPRPVPARNQSCAPAVRADASDRTDTANKTYNLDDDLKTTSDELVGPAFVGLKSHACPPSS